MTELEEKAKVLIKIWETTKCECKKDELCNRCKIETGLRMTDDILNIVLDDVGVKKWQENMN